MNQRFNFKYKLSSDKEWVRTNLAYNVKKVVSRVDFVRCEFNEYSNELTLNGTEENVGQFVIELESRGVILNNCDKL